MIRESDLSQTAVMLLAFGGPRSADEIGPFMERLMGKNPSPKQIEGLQKRYQAIGGASPLPEMTAFFAVFASARTAGLPATDSTDCQENIDSLTASNMSNLGLIYPIGIIVFLTLGT